MFFSGFFVFFAERSGELSGAICLKTLVLLDNDR